MEGEERCIDLPLAGLALEGKGVKLWNMAFAGRFLGSCPKYHVDSLSLLPQ